VFFVAYDDQEYYKVAGSFNEFINKSYIKNYKFTYEVKKLLVNY